MYKTNPLLFCVEIVSRYCLAPFQRHPRRFSITTVTLWLPRENLSLIFINISLPGRNRWWGGHVAFGSEGPFSLVLCNNWRKFRFEDYAQYALMIDAWLQRRERPWVATARSWEIWEKQQQKGQERIRQKGSVNVQYQ